VNYFCQTMTPRLATQYQKAEPQKSKSSKISAAFFVALSLALSGCNSPEQPTNTATSSSAQQTNNTEASAIETVKIGVVVPLTGPQAHLGKEFKEGATMAAETINAEMVTSNTLVNGKKIKFEIVAEDDQADPKTATLVAQKMADQGIKGIVGHLNSGTSIPASRIYAEAGIPQISPSATAVAYTAQGYATTFRVVANDAHQGAVLGESAVTRLGAKKAAVIDDRTAYGQGLADQVEKSIQAAGGAIVAREFTTDKSTDFTAILTSIKSKAPDLIFFGGMDTQAAPLIKQMRALGMTQILLVGDGSQSAEYIRIAGEAAEGTIGSSPGLPIEQMPKGPDFVTKFTAKYGQIQNYAPYAHDAAAVLMTAIQQANSTETETYLPTLKNIQYAGVTGVISFDSKGDIKNGAITLYQVKNGQWQVLNVVRPNP
jgi:branched-chain amino acid transport system substrate-binding protein